MEKKRLGYVEVRVTWFRPATTGAIPSSLRVTTDSAAPRHGAQARHPAMSHCITTVLSKIILQTLLLSSLDDACTRNNINNISIHQYCINDQDLVGRRMRGAEAVGKGSSQYGSDNNGDKRTPTPVR